MKGGLHLMRGESTGPEFVTDLWQWLVVKIGDIIETTVDGRDLVFREFQLDLLLPKLVQCQIVIRGWLLGQKRLHLLEALGIDTSHATVVAINTPLQDFCDAVHG